MSERGPAVRKVAPAEPRSGVGGEALPQHWLDLYEALRREVAAMGGFGLLVLEISVTDGLPRSVHLVRREATYLLGKSQPPLTGASPLEGPASGGDDRT